MESGDYKSALSVEFVFIIKKNTGKLFAATSNPKDKYCC